MTRMETPLKTLKVGQSYRTTNTGGVMIRILGIVEEDGKCLVVLELNRSNGTKVIEHQPYEKLLQQMNAWQMVEVPTITPAPTL